MKRAFALLFVFILVASVTASAASHTKGRAVHPSTIEFKPGDYVWHPEKAPAGPVSIIMSTADQEEYVYRDGIEIGRAAMSTTGLEQNLGSHVYSALDKFDADRRCEWISTASFGDVRAPDVKDLDQRATIAPEFLERTRSVVSPGATLILTDMRVGSQTLSGPGVNVLTAR